jgi:hypothetical protein
LKFLEILRHYLLLFSIGKLYNKSENRATNTAKICPNIEIINEIITTPYIIYPTIVQISYAKVIYTTQAPVINFRLANNRKTIHNFFDDPTYELFHDVMVHGQFTHRWHHITQTFTNPSIYLKNEYPKINSIIQTLKQYISNTNGNTPDNYNNQLLTFVIFNIVHEYNDILGLYNLIGSIKNILERKKDKKYYELFLEDTSLQDAVIYAYSQKKSSPNSTLTKEQLLKEIKPDQTLNNYLINYVLEKFNSLFESINALIDSLIGGSYNKKKYCKKLYKYKTKKQIKRKHKKTLTQ